MAPDPPILDYENTPAKRPVSGLAIAAVALGVAGCPCWSQMIPVLVERLLGWRVSFGLSVVLIGGPSFIGLLLGVVAAVSIRRSAGRISGIDWARLAICLNLLWIGMVALGIVIGD